MTFKKKQIMMNKLLDIFTFLCQYTTMHTQTALLMSFLKLPQYIYQPRAPAVGDRGCQLTQFV